MRKTKNLKSDLSFTKLKVAVIGTGGIAGTHLESIKTSPDLALVGCCDILAEKVEKIVAEHGGHAYTNSEKMLDVEKPDLVMICTPPMVRIDPIRLCAERKIAAFIEKPPADNLERAHEIKAILKKHPIIHSVGFVLRYLNLVEQALQLLKGHPLLMIRYFYFCPMSLPEYHKNFSRFYFQKELSGGLVGDQGIHSLDLMRYITGSEVATVYGLGNNLQHPKGDYFTSDETVSVNLRMENRVVVSYVHTWAYPKWQVEAELIAVNAHLHLNLSTYSIKGEVDGRQVEHQQEENPYFNELRAIVQAIGEKSMKPIRSTYSDSLKTFAVALALNQSLESGEPVVPVHG